MSALSLQTSRSSLYSSSFDATRPDSAAPPSSSPPFNSVDQEDKENATIKAKPLPNHGMNGKSQDDSELRLLAISGHMTELSYAISDIQTRLFEIQELRHKSQSSSAEATGDVETTAAIDQSLITLEEKIQTLSTGMKSVGEALQPLADQQQADATTPTTAVGNETAALLRKHGTLVQDWQGVQEENEQLKEELKEDKWLTVFRTVATQADGMMTSLEKGVRRCQDFISLVRKGQAGGPDLFAASRSSLTADTVNVETYTALLRSFEAKKKYYMPACSKVLGIIDKGVQDRVTKNGETLRGHAEAAQRWRTLRDQIAKTDSDMERVYIILTTGDSASDTGSSQDGTFPHRNDYLATPQSGGTTRTRSQDKSLSGSISPLRKFARKITGSSKSPLSPTEPLPPASGSSHRTRASIFSLKSSQSPSASRDRFGHKHTQSLTPDSSPGKGSRADRDVTIKARDSPNAKQRWNSSTKVERVDQTGTIRATPSRPPSSAAGYFDNNNASSGQRSASRASMASSRPWSPLSSSISTTYSSSHLPTPSFSPSRAQTPMRARTPSRPASRAYTPAAPPTPRARAKTPSHIPMPALQLGHQTSPSSKSNGSVTRPFSPAMSVTSNDFSPNAHPARPPSRSMIPIPAVHLSSPSRPSTSMSSYSSRPESSTGFFRSYGARAQTPENTLKGKGKVYPGSVGRATSGTITRRQPPSSFRDGSASSSSRPSSRSASRSGAYTPSGMDGPLYEYIPANLKDPLDVELANIANSLPHTLQIERIDAPLRKAPKEGEEVKAQYSFTTPLGSKVITCRLTTMVRMGRAGSDTTKKVMVRVGGGWQDLAQYIASRQGM